MIHQAYENAKKARKNDRKRKIPNKIIPKSAQPPSKPAPPWAPMPSRAPPGPVPKKAPPPMPSWQSEPAKPPPKPQPPSPPVNHDYICQKDTGGASSSTSGWKDYVAVRNGLMVHAKAKVRACSPITEELPATSNSEDTRIPSKTDNRGSYRDPCRHCGMKNPDHPGRDCPKLARKVPGISTAEWSKHERDEEEECRLNALEREHARKIAEQAAYDQGIRRSHAWHDNYAKYIPRASDLLKN